MESYHQQTPKKARELERHVSFYKRKDSDDQCIIGKPKHLHIFSLLIPKCVVKSLVKIQRDFLWSGS
ncbi:unnamed protein product [Linum trigynum]|uniref:Uncharacterized protein n=1 Tax=Linum trigynum TaxID=586398 RepID=A0AAV2GB07_9ROSI